MSPRFRLVFLLLAAVGLACGLAAGLARLGIRIPAGHAIAFHGALMVSGFLGTVISLERAVALGSRIAYAAPLASGAGTLLLLAGAITAGLALWVAAALLLLGASVAIARRQPELHTILLAIAAVAWGVGGVAFVTGRGAAAPAWWFAFLVLTIAAERLEMTRLTRRPRFAAPLFVALTGLLLAGAAATLWQWELAPVVFGAALVGLAAWLAAFDIARHTLRASGFARYAAAALIGGYAWLVVGGAAWMLSPAYRDAALHALGLGFVFSMIFAHAPLVVPVVLRIRLRFTSFFYAPLALLHLSLGVRLLAGADDLGMRAAGGLLNAVAIAAFVATVVWTVARASGGVADDAAALRHRAS